MYDPQKVIDIALSEVGYREKASKSKLDDKNANAGVKNYTKFAALMDSIKGWYNGRKQGVAWCAVFVHSCFVRAYGIEAAQRMLYLPNNSSGAGVRWCRIYALRAREYWGTKGNVPRPGDQIIFKKLNDPDPNAMQHTGLVRAVDGQRVYTVEGNTSNRVMLKQYLLNDAKIDGYVRPDYGIGIVISTPFIVEPIPSPTVRPTLRKKSTGMYVTELQTKLNENGSTLKVDGIFGSMTLKEVKAYQKEKLLKVDGIVGPITWGSLLGKAVTKA
jgi:hypothetical protein